MPIAAIAFDFDPLLRLSDTLVLRWQTVGLVAVIAAGLIVCGLIARRESLRPDDLLLIAVASVPGAVVGGRLGYLLLHLDYYGSHSEAVLDPAQGSLELGLAIVGGVLSSSYVAALLGAPIGHWLRTTAMPLLFVLGTGKLTMVLGGAGQGQPAGIAWATAYGGPGPWGSLAPDVPSHPSQVYEGLATLVILLVLTAVVASGWFRSRDGRLFFLVLGAWAVARAAVSLTWRDPPVAAGLNAGGLLAVAIALGSVVGYVLVARRHAGTTTQRGTRREVTWADPEARPRF